MIKHHLPAAVLSTLMLTAALTVGMHAWLFSAMPSLDSLPQQWNNPSVRITDRDGELLYEILGENGGRHMVLSLDAIPITLRQATIATEDRSFYSNPGIDPSGILRALWTNLSSGAALSGGSTITQQVARNLLLDPEERVQQSLRRKLREALLAWQLTQRFSKDEILALYLNQTYYGALAYGVEAASQTYFGKPAAHLDLAESALLAGLPQAPSRYDPFNSPKAAIKRQQIVLDLMQKAGFIDDQTWSAAGRQKLIFSSAPYPIKAPHFVMMVKDEIEAKYTQEQIRQLGGLVVRTTLDLEWQTHAESAVAYQLAELQSSEDSLGHNVNNAALIALDPHSGEILSLVGSPDFFDAENNGFINMALAPRQPGSALKPFLYATALDPSIPDPWTAATMLLDVRTSFTTREDRAYTPTNYDQQEHGPVSVRQALASSLNIPAVITLEHIGLERLFQQASLLGITTLHDPERYDLSLALGGGEVRLLELTAAYGAFATGGLRVEPHAILEISDSQGNPLYKTSTLPGMRVLDERLAWLISDILSDNNARQLGFSSNSVLRLDRPAAVKTGTTSNFHDNWTVGYTPDLVVGVWTGNASYEPMRAVDGLSGAAPIWHSFMRTVLSGTAPKPFLHPPGLLQMEVCGLSGLQPTPACPYNKGEWFIDGTQPTRSDNLYQQVQVDIATGLPAEIATPQERRKILTVLDLPPQAASWAHSQGLTLLGDLGINFQNQVGRIESGGVIQSAGPLLLVISPPQGSLFHLDPAFVAGAQRVLLEAVGDGSLREVSLWVDGELLKRFEHPPYQTWWQLTPGAHTVWAQGKDTGGVSQTSEPVTFEVK